jgi:hypothetical protein
MYKENKINKYQSEIKQELTKLLPPSVPSEKYRERAEFSKCAVCMGINMGRMARWYVWRRD